MFPKLGIGCWSFGGGDYWGHQNQNDVNDVVNNAYENGINYFDTAEVYNNGNSEISLGIATKNIRKKIIIGTKISPNHSQPKLIKNYLNESLKRLNTSYVDLYMLHWPLNPVSFNHYTKDELNVNFTINDVLEKFEKFKKEGKILHYGVCNFGPNQINEIFNDFNITVNQIPYSLLFRSAEYNLLDLCKKKNIKTLGYMSLMQGLLTGKYYNPDDVPLNRARTRHFNSIKRNKSRTNEEGFELQTFETINSLRKICDNINLTMSDLSILWSLSKIDCTIIGCRDKNQFIKNYESINKNITIPIYTKLDELTNNLKNLMGNNLDMYENIKKQRSN